MHRLSTVPLLCTLLVAGAAVAAPAAARTIPVSTEADSGAGSLRAAVTSAVDGDVIDVPAGTYRLTSAGLVTSRSITIAGAGVGATTISGGGTRQILHFTGTLPVTLRDLTLTRGFTSDKGGAIETVQPLTLTRVALTGNEAAVGGGALASQAPLTFTDVALTQNRSPFAGAITHAGAPFTFERVLISGNTADDIGGMVATGVGVSSMTNTTIADNTATDNIGGFELSSSPPAAMVTIQNSTIAGNRALGAGIVGGFVLSTNQQVNLRNTIVAGNTGSMGTIGCYGPGSLVSLGHNVTDAVTPIDDCALDGTGDHSPADPLLGALGAHGGLFLTRLPAAGSPAIDKGDAASCPVVDARGIARPKGAGCDVGAVELAPPNVTTDGAADPSSGGATLVGTVQPFGFAGSAWFEYGTTTAYGSQSASVAFGGGPTSETVIRFVSGLSEQTTYHYRLVATTAEGTTHGPDKTFTTGAAGGPGGGAGGSGGTGGGANGNGGTGGNGNPTPIVALPSQPARCVVPRLKGLALATARRRLARAHCALGRVTRPRSVRRGARLVVRRQSPAAGRRLADSARVAVTLGVKPAVKRRPARSRG